MIGVLLIAALSAVALGGALVLGRAHVRGLVSSCRRRERREWGSRASGRSGPATTLGAGFASSFDPRFGVDGLSGLFLGTLGLIAAPALVFSLRYLEPDSKGTGGLRRSPRAFVLALALVVCARDPLSFLTGWELMTLLSAGVILVARRADRLSRQTVFNYLAVTHLGGVGTWVAILLLAQADAIGNPAAISSGSGLQTAIALAALVGMGTKAGVMPLHVWLPRAHPIAPAPVSALMSGVMIKVALYGLVRVLVEWVGVLPVWFGVLVLAVGALSAVGGIVYALFQHDLKRLLALSSIENVGIVVLGLGACLILRARGADAWAAFALGAALLHVVNHAVFKSLLFLGAGAFERAVGLARARPARWAAAPDALDGRRLPHRRDGDLRPPATERLRLGVADAAGAASRGGIRPRRRRHRGRGRARRPRFDGGAGALLLRQGRRPRPARDGANRGGRRTAEEAPLPMRAGVVFLAGGCVALGVAPGLLYGELVGLAPWSPGLPAHVGLQLPGTGSLPGAWIAVVLVALTAGLVAPARYSNRRTRTGLGFRPAPRAGSPLDRRRLHEAASPGARAGAAPAAGDRGAERGRRPAGGLLQRPCARADRGARLRAAGPRVPRRRRPHAAACRAAASAPTSPTLPALVLVLLAAARLGWIG